MANIFDRAFAYVVGVEGPLSLVPSDPGNWTGGVVGKGELRGTRYGISASQYPTLNIAVLTLADARALYLRDYWTAGRCDQLPDALAFSFFDACANEGVPEATRILQRALDVEVDGILGPNTIRAAQAISEQDAVVNFQGERIVAYASLGTWHVFGRGWARRTVRTGIEAVS